MSREDPPGRRAAPEAIRSSETGGSAPEAPSPGEEPITSSGVVPVDVGSGSSEREPITGSGVVPADVGSGSSGRESSSGVVPADVTSGEPERESVTSSAVVPVRAEDTQGRSVASRTPPEARKRRRSEPPLRTLTPYQARLDVDMDDTAVSKVRDPSASIRLGPEGDLIRARRGSFGGPNRTRATNVAQVVLGVSFGFLVVWVVSLVWSWSSRDPVVVRPSSAALSAVAAAGSVAGATRPARPPVAFPRCRIAAPQRRLFGVQRGVAPVVRAFGSRVAVGFSKLPGHAVGVVLSPAELEPEIAFRQWKPRPVERVVPWVTPDADIRFDVQRLASRTKDIALGTAAHTRVKAGRNGLVVTDDGGRVHSLWPLGAGQVVDIDSVRVGERHAILIVTDEPSQAWVGWVDGSGLAVSQLFPISLEGGAIGRATLAGGADSALVVSSLSTAGGAAVARVPVGGAPERVFRPGLADSALLVGPLHAAPLRGGAWWVQGFEKRGGEKQLVGRVVASDFQSVGEPVILDGNPTLEQSAGAAAVGGRVVSFGIGTREGARQLWATALECTP